MCLLTELHKRLAARKPGRPAASKASGRANVRTGRALARVRQSAGFTLTEALATVIIVGLVTTILAGGISLATSQYAKQMASSEAQMLYSSLQKIMDTELRFTKTIRIPDGETAATGNELTVLGFESKHYVPNNTGTGSVNISVLCTVDAESEGATRQPSIPGQLAMATEIASSGAVVSTFLGEGAYNYGLKARVKSLTYVKSGRYFVVDLAIVKSPDNTVLAQGTFTVRALNLTAALNENGDHPLNEATNPSPGTGTGSGSGTGEGSSGTGTGEGGGSTGGSSGTGGSFIVTVGDDSLVIQDTQEDIEYHVSTKPFETVKTEGAASGTVLVATANNSTVYYFVNKKLDSGSTPSTDPSNGNSAVLIPIVCGQDGKPVVYMYSADMVDSITQVGTLCIEDGKLYILTNKNGKIGAPSKDNGHWEIVSVL